MNPLIEEVRQFLEGLKRDLPETFPLPRLETESGRRIPFRGGELAFRMERDPASVRSVIRESGEGLVLVRAEDDAAPPRELLRDWYREQAGRIFSERAAHWSREMGVSFRAVRIKDQRTLWGSCSRQGNLNFNWRVVMAPPEVLDYLVIHELAHLLEMNHSRRFWGHVARWCPEHRDRRRWLKEHGRGLQSRLRAASRTRFF